MMEDKLTVNVQKNTLKLLGISEKRELLVDVLCEGS